MSDSQAGVADALRGLVDGLAQSLAQTLQSMTDGRPEVDWETFHGRIPDSEAGPDAEMLWWEQGFQILEQPALWLGAARGTWEELGTRTLRAAGLEAVDVADARNTWLEILNQALSAVARIVAERLGQEVTCANGAERTPPLEAERWVKIRLSYETALPPLWVLPGTALLDQLGSAPGDLALGTHARPSATVDGDEAETHGVGAGGSRTMDLLLDVELPVSISFGTSEIPLKDVLKLTTGSIVELNRGVGEPVEVLVNRCLVARGEVVVVDGNYAVRIQQIVSPQERLRTVR